MIPLAFALVEVRHLAFATHLTNVDYFPQVEWALRLRPDDLAGWMSPYYPAGFPWLVRLGLGLGLDAARVGQALAVLGGVLGLMGAYLLALAFSRSQGPALIAQGLVAVNAHYLRFGGFEGNDLLAAGLQALGVGLLARGLTAPRPAQARWAAIAGAALGLGYLIRYPSLVTAGVGAVALAVAAARLRSRAALRSLGAFAGLFVLVAAPQWVPSLLVTGSPFSSDQGESVWFQVNQKSDYIVERSQAPPGITVLGVFRGDPGRFVAHWLSNFQQFWLKTGPELFSWPLGMLALLGLAFLAVGRGPAPLELRALAVLFVLAHVAVLSLLRIDPRFLVVLLPVLATALMVTAREVIQRSLPPGRHGGAGLGASLAAVLVSIPGALPIAASQPGPPPQVARVSDLLRAAGADGPEQVLSTELEYHDLSSPARLRYPQAYWVAPGHSTLEGLLEEARQRGFRFLLFGQAAGPRVYPALTELLSPERRHPGLTPIYKDPRLAVYRIEGLGGAPGAEARPLARFEGGIELGSAMGRVSRSAVEPAWDLGLYLGWTARAPVPEGYKVFVHLVDASGQLAAQDDAVPVAWTYPTTAWRPGETVMDYHQVRVAAGPGALFQVVVGLYQETSGVRVGVLDAAGGRIDDKAVVGALVWRDDALVFRPREG